MGEKLHPLSVNWVQNGLKKMIRQPTSDRTSED